MSLNFTSKCRPLNALIRWELKMTTDRPKTLRRDARDNAIKLRAAALEVFLAKGLNAPLEEIAQVAGVSIGTLYNRFGSREGLIDAVIPEVVGTRLQSLAQTVLTETSSRERLRQFVVGMIDLQLADPALNDAILRRFPDATAVVEICDVTTNLGKDLVAEAHLDGSLSAEFTADDLFSVLWFAGNASHDPNAPARWRRVLERSLDAAWTS